MLHTDLNINHTGYATDNARRCSTLAARFSHQFLARAGGEEGGLWRRSGRCLGCVSELDCCKVGFLCGYYRVGSRYRMRYLYY